MNAVLLTRTPACRGRVRPRGFTCYFVLAAAVTPASPPTVATTTAPLPLDVPLLQRTLKMAAFAVDAYTYPVAITRWPDGPERDGVVKQWWPPVDENSMNKTLVRLSHTADDLAKGQGHPLLCGPDLTKVANVLCTTPVFGPNTSATVWWRCEAGESKGTIVVAFKGTDFRDFNDILTDVSLWETAVENSADMVHEGFSNAYACVSAPLSEIIMELTHSSPPGTPFTIHATGHSLGASLPCRTPRGAVATLFAFHASRVEGNTLWPRPGPNGSPRPAILLTTYGCPRVGDRRFGAAFSTPPPGGGAPPDALRVVHAADIVPRVPLSAGPLRVGYAHVCLDAGGRPLPNTLLHLAADGSALPPGPLLFPIYGGLISLQASVVDHRMASYTVAFTKAVAAASAAALLKPLV